MIANFFGEPVPALLDLRCSALGVLHEQARESVDVCRHGSKLCRGRGKTDDQISVVGRLDRRRQAVDQTSKVCTLRHIGGARQRAKRTA